MPEGLGPRFVLEAAFLVVLAAVATYARLEPVEIVLVMAAGWLLASLFEVLANVRERVDRAERWEHRVDAEPAPPAAPAEEPQAAVGASEQASVSAEPVAASATPTKAVSPDDESTGEFELPAPKRRRWFRREPKEAEPVEEAPPRPSPRHVRLIKTPAPREQSAEPEDAELG